MPGEGEKVAAMSAWQAGHNSPSAVGSHMGHSGTPGSVRRPGAPHVIRGYGPVPAWLAALERQGRATGAEGGRVCAWLGCARLVIDRVEGRPYCARHVPWAQAFATRAPCVPPPWLSIRERFPPLWAMSSPPRRAELDAALRVNLARMEFTGLESLLAMLAGPVSAGDGRGH